MAYIVNGSPQVVDLGTDDQSTRQVFPEAIPTPQHLPKVFLFTQKGPKTPQLVDSATRTEMYGSDSFNEMKPYFNHATALSNLFAREGNVQMIQRVVPADAQTANVRLWLDIVEDDNTPDYPRLADGSIDPTGVAGVVNGYRYRWYYEVVAGGIGTLGTAAPAAGYLAGGTVGGNPTTSTMYPILEFTASSEGVYGNNAGFNLSVPSASQLNSALLANYILPYALGFVQRADANSSAKAFRTLFGEERANLVFVQDALNPVDGSPYDFDRIFPDRWENTNDPRYRMSFADINNGFAYYNNIETIVDMIVAKEYTYAQANPAWYDYDTTDQALIQGDRKNITNWLTGRSLKNVQYVTFTADNQALGVALPAGFTEFTPGSATNIWLGDGSDGTMDNVNFEAAVISALDDYTDPDSQVMDTAINVESILYDSGFTMGTKQELPKFIALRKDTFVVLGTYVDGEAPLDVATESSRTTTLMATLSLYPESDYFGTPVTRGLVVGQSGVERGSIKKQRRPMTFELALKASRYMGAGDEKWKTGFNFDGAPGSIIESLYDIQPDFIPASTKPMLWDSGMVWVQPYDRRSFFFPAIQTAYPNDTSVLNSFITAMALTYINKVAHRAWRRFSGTSGLTNEQFLQRVKNFVDNELAFKFDNRFKIVTNAFLSAGDEARGYSWSLAVKIGAPNMKTVMTTYTEAFRIEDLQQ